MCHCQIGGQSRYGGKRPCYIGADAIGSNVRTLTLYGSARIFASLIPFRIIRILRVLYKAFSARSAYNTVALMASYGALVELNALFSEEQCQSWNSAASLAFLAHFQTVLEAPGSTPFLGEEARDVTITYM
jgi:hypothetical protein